MNEFERIKELLCNFHIVSGNTVKNTENLCCIDYSTNPLNPNLMSYCFDNILGFDVKYRIFEKVNYIISFDYKGTYGRVEHHKLCYLFYIDKQYHEEVLELFRTIKQLLQELFLSLAINSLDKNYFTMENEYIYYFEKLQFYHNKIETLNNRYNTITEKLNGQWITINLGKYSRMEPKGQAVLKSMHKELLYSIESYIDVFYSFLEHTLTLLYPFSENFDLSKSYKEYIQNPKWTWDKKLLAVVNTSEINQYIDELRKIKEIYRNRNSHGMFSRELKAYIGINGFGLYPMYIGKQYLQGFIEEYDTSLNYPKYLEIKYILDKFLKILENNYAIPMMFIKSGLPIPVDVSNLTKDIKSEDEAECKIDRLWYDLDNQSNMDW